jgi:hypothetical protein
MDSEEDRYRAEGEKGLRQWRADHKEGGTGIDICFRIGVPCEEIAAVAKELKTDLIVISTHHYHWFDHLMNGSDAERIVRRAPCPILVFLRRVGNNKGQTVVQLRSEQLLGGGRFQWIRLK